ncbi:MAG TPA: hypothetical protein VEA69_06000 [Tepidisphaeraceae bacterium]|nr:hypothetical protein [Tepidisphaeraceae bacterium]
MTLTARKRRTVRLVDLPGRPGETMACDATSRTDALDLLIKGETVTTAGSNGAMNLWRAGGEWRAEFMRYMVRISCISTNKVSEVRAWLREWWPKLGK